MTSRRHVAFIVVMTLTAFALAGIALLLIDMTL